MVTTYKKVVVENAVLGVWAAPGEHLSQTVTFPFKATIREIRVSKRSTRQWGLYIRANDRRILAVRSDELPHKLLVPQTFNTMDSCKVEFEGRPEVEDYLGYFAIEFIGDYEIQVTELLPE